MKDGRAALKCLPEWRTLIGIVQAAAGCRLARGARFLSLSRLDLVHVWLALLRRVQVSGVGIDLLALLCGPSLLAVGDVGHDREYRHGGAHRPTGKDWCGSARHGSRHVVEGRRSSDVHSGRMVVINHMMSPARHHNLSTKREQ
jgi:hypothetical protein